jgi:hypothetical protein
MSDPPYWCFLLFTLFYFLLNKKKKHMGVLFGYGAPFILFEKIICEFRFVRCTWYMDYFNIPAKTWQQGKT